MRALRLLDRARGQRQLHHIQRQAKGFDMRARPHQLIQAPVMRIARRIDADMGDAKLRPHAVILVVARPDLRADIHPRLPS
jgi:hypothetical protein